MKILNVQLFLFVLFCIVASVMSMNPESRMMEKHEGKGVACRGRWRHRGQNNGGNGDGNGNNDQNAKGGDSEPGGSTGDAETV